MKNRLSILLVLALLIGSCSKGRDNTAVTPTPTPTPVDSNAMKYTVNGITDIRMGANDDSIVLLGIIHTGGKQENLTLSATDLPSGISATFETPSGIPSFSTKLTYKSNVATAGTYDIKIKAVTASNVEKLFNLKLTINTPPPPPPPDSGCANNIKGAHINTYTGGGGGTTTTNIIYVSQDVVKFSKLPGFPDDVTAYLDCNNKTFNLNNQVSGSLSINGSGNFSNLNKITVDYVVNTGSGGNYYYCELTK